MKKFFITTLLILASIIPSYAVWGTDAARAVAYTYMGKIESSAVYSNAFAYSLNLTGHKLSENKMKTMKWCMDRYNEALDSISDAISVAANCYGLFFEVDKAIDNIAQLRNTTSKNPDNIVAVALSPTRQKMYERVLNDGLDLISDLPMVLPIKLGKKDGTKMNMGERLMNISKIREKLHNLNKDISRLTYILTYTTMLDTYYELGGQRMYRTKDIKTIVALCKQRWYTAQFDAWHATVGANVWVTQLRNQAKIIFSY
ncbi:MAG: hypothetical protein PUD15_08600 [Prevotella sp.]|nr:hypothetical protein [Prevotella sp.]